MPWYRFTPAVPLSSKPRPALASLYLWDGVTGEPEEERDARLFAEAAPRLNEPYGYGLELLEGHPPAEAVEALRAHYEALRDKAMWALANLEPPPRCAGCGCLRAQMFGGQENHAGGCPWFPL